MGVITQIAPLDATCATWAATPGPPFNVLQFKQQLFTTGSSGVLTFTQTSGASDLTVASHGLVRAAANLAAGVYTCGGTTADTGGNSGTFAFTLTVTSGLPLPPQGGVSISFSQPAFSGYPNWVRIDDPSGSLPGVSQYTIDRGRPSMLDTTQAGTAQITILDNDGTYDPTNLDSPYYGNPGDPYSSEIGPMRAVNIQLLNPVNSQYHSIFTGFTESWSYSFPATPSNVLMQVVVGCADGFEPLARAELLPDPQGSTLFAAIVGANAVKLRMLAVLANFQSYDSALNAYPTDPAAIFSGNINLLSSSYPPHTSLLAALQDAADAEFPGVANLFMDKFGNVAFRGRVPRFLPQNYVNGSGPPTLAQPITRWACGDEIQSEFRQIAPIHEIEWAIDNASVINSCQCYPGGPGDIASMPKVLTNQTAYNPASIQQFGARILAIPNLYTAGSPASTGNPYLEPAGLDGLQETLLYAQSYVANFGLPTPRITKLTFVTQDPSTAVGQAFWNLATGVEIGDTISVYTTNPGGGGFSSPFDIDSHGNIDQFFVEGIHYTVTAGGPYPQILLTLDVSPREWFTWFNGFVFYGEAINFGPVVGSGSDGQVINGNNSFTSLSGGTTTPPGFSSDDVGKTIIICDQSTNTIFTSTVASVGGSTTLTMADNYTGGTVSDAPWEIVEL